ncbi:MAG TPA: hypothetical protein VKS01_12350 [Bryobacteraceae bacterium]|nr:hypothetical protein [Bryobacteraceae bacterium]
MTDWRAVSKALNTGIPGDQLDRLAPVLEQLERVWEPLRESIPAGAEMWEPE